VCLCLLVCGRCCGGCAEVVLVRVVCGVCALEVVCWLVWCSTGARVNAVRRRSHELQVRVQGAVLMWRLCEDRLAVV